MGSDYFHNPTLESHCIAVHKETSCPADTKRKLFSEKIKMTRCANVIFVLLGTLKQLLDAAITDIRFIQSCQVKSNLGMLSPEITCLE